MYLDKRIRSREMDNLNMVRATFTRVRQHKQVMVFTKQRT